MKKVKTLCIDANDDTLEIKITDENWDPIVEVRFLNDKSYSIFLYLLGRGLQKLGFRDGGATGGGKHTVSTFINEKEVRIPSDFTSLSFHVKGEFE